MKRDAKANAELVSSHKSYADFNQKERSDDAFMANNKHPNAKHYQALRKFFDSLAYACNSNARLFSYKNDVEYSQYYGPSLDVSWYPQGEVGRNFGHIYPAHENWMVYLKACSEAHWPKDVAPRLEAGSFYVSTKNEDLVKALTNLRNIHKDQVHVRSTHTGRINESLPKVEGEAQVEYFTLVDVQYLGKFSMRIHHEVLKLLKRHHKGYVLPKRTLAATQADEAPIPLAEKRMALGNVEKLTETPRLILVPLIPLGNQGGQLLEETFQGFINLLDKGWSFIQAKQWLQKFATKKAFKDLEKKYAVA